MPIIAHSGVLTFIVIYRKRSQTKIHSIRDNWFSGDIWFWLTLSVFVRYQDVKAIEMCFWWYSTNLHKFYKVSATYRHRRYYLFNLSFIYNFPLLFLFFFLRISYPCNICLHQKRRIPAGTHTWSFLRNSDKYHLGNIPTDTRQRPRICQPSSWIQDNRRTRIRPLCLYTSRFRKCPVSARTRLSRWSAAVVASKACCNRL